MQYIDYLPWVSSILAIVFAAVLALSIRKKSSGTEKMKEISDLIHQGALTYLNKQYKFLTVFIVIVAVVLLVVINKETSVAFVIGAFFSALTGNIGMRISTTANAKTVEGCRKNLNEGLKIAFSSGAVMGLCVVGIGLFGVSLLYLLFGNSEIIYGFGFGASSIALFARVGGGIYTKGADVGADLVGKVEKGIPEDDPRNPAVIADLVGDNVGDVSGMGADLFESYVNSIIATMAVGIVVTTFAGAVVLPMMLAGLGILASVGGSFFVRTSGSNAQSALNKGIFAAAIIMFIVSYPLIIYVSGPAGINVWYATVSGLVAGIVIGLATEFYTSGGRGPVQSIAEASQTGAGTTIISGLAVGMKSTVIPVLAVGAAIMISYQFAGLYGVAISAVGMLSTLGITLATDTYGPVADNAAGISEMAGLDEEIRDRASSLDAVGNTTAAIGKGFAIGSAALTALALFVAFGQKFSLSGMSLANPFVVTGLFIGALLPFLFSAFALNAVGKAASHIINEVRRQFREIKGLMEGKTKADYSRCIAISTEAAMKQMIIPGSIAIIAPLAVGILLGPEALGGLLAGATSAGFLLAVMMANSGGAWDNAKKYIEAGHLGGKGSPTHKAAVIGDTVGDPFKDTAGPSMNILIKLMSIVALVFAPLFI